MINQSGQCKVGSPDLLTSYQAGRLGADDTIRLDRHVGDCADCQAFLEGQGLVWDALEAYGRVVPPISGNFDQLLYARIAGETSENWWQRAWRRLFEAGEPANWKPVGAMAMACLVLAVGVGFQTAQNRPPASPGRAVASSAGPVTRAVPVLPAGFDRSEIESIERALEDFEMLNKMGAPAQELAEKL